MEITIKATDIQLPEGVSFRKGYKGHVHVDTGMRWKVHLPNLLNEIISSNVQLAVLYRPFQILCSLLSQLAGRALELNDPELNKLMLMLGLYELNDEEEIQEGKK